MFGKMPVIKELKVTLPAWLALAFDMDECMMSPLYCSERAALMSSRNGPLTMEEEEELFLRHNAQALATIVDAAKKHFQRVYLLLGSKRQDKSTDDLNNRMKGTISAVLAMQFLTKYLCKELLNIPVKLLPFAMADSSIGSAADLGNIGKTFEHILSNSTEPGPIWAGMDSEKQTIVYAHTHYLGHIRKQEKQENVEIVYALIDDASNILNTCTQSVAFKPEHFPANIKIRTVFYNGGSCSELVSSLKPELQGLSGKGDVDERFMQTLRYIEEEKATPQVWQQENFNYYDLRFNGVADFHAAIQVAKLELSCDEFCSPDFF